MILALFVRMTDGKQPEQLNFECELSHGRSTKLIGNQTLSVQRPYETLWTHSLKVAVVLFVKVYKKVSSD